MKKSVEVGVVALSCRCLVCICRLFLVYCAFNGSFKLRAVAYSTSCDSGGDHHIILVA